MTGDHSIFCSYGRLPITGPWVNRIGLGLVRWSWTSWLSKIDIWIGRVGPPTWVIVKQPEYSIGFAPRIGPSPRAGAPLLGRTNGPLSLIFQTLSVAPQPLCTVCVGKGCNVARIGCNIHVSARDWGS